MKRWDPEITEVVRGLWLEGTSGDDIAIILKAEFGIELTRSAIMGKIGRLNLFGKKRAPRWEASWKAHNAGQSA